MGFSPAQLADAVANGLCPAEAIRPRKPARGAAVPAPTTPASVTRFEVVLPLPPTTNNLYLNVRGRGRVVTPAYRKWKADAAEVLTGSPAVRTPVAVAVTVLPGGWLTPARRWDCESRLKATVDACVAAGIIPDDDHQFVAVVSADWDHTHVGPAGVRVLVETVAPGECRL